MEADPDEVLSVNIPYLKTLIKPNSIALELLLWQTSGSIKIIEQAY